MANPLLLFLTRSGDVRRHYGPRRPVAVPREVPSTDAIFLMLRRLRTPLIVLVLIFTISVVGLTLIPGVDENGRPNHIGVFEAFYFISYTATTIGFGEIQDLTTPQRMWMTFSIYLTVIGWAYAIGTSLSLMQDRAVKEALATHAFGRRIRRMREDFVLVAGYGKAGRQVVRELDWHGKRVVVVDKDQDAIDRLAADSLWADVPGIAANAALPGVLGLAGLGSPRCAAVMALTDDDDVNLAVVMAGSLLRPEVPVIARCQSRTIETAMREFSASAVINPSDRFGAYLVLALQRPSTYRLVSWLMAEHDSAGPEIPTGLGEGRWVVAGQGQFAEEVTADLRTAGMTVDIVDPRAGHPDVTGAAGFIAGTKIDTLNLALVEQVRQDNPDLFVAVRQDSPASRSLVEALEIDSVYSPTDLVAKEALARVITPIFWGFVEHALQQDDEWAAGLLHRVLELCGDTAPERRMFTLDRRGAPAIERWLRHSPCTVGDLLRHPDDRDTPLAAVPLLVVRSDETIYAPEDDTALRRGDRVLVAGRAQSLEELIQTLDYDSIAEYVTTGRRVPDSWIWRRLTRVRGRGESPHRGSQRRTSNDS